MAAGLEAGCGAALAAGFFSAAFGVDFGEAFGANFGADLDAAASALETGLALDLVDVAGAALAAFLDVGDAFVTDFIASLTTGLALVAGATLALDVETLTGAAGLLPDLDAATVEDLGAGLAAARTGLEVDTDLAGLAAAAGLVTDVLVLAGELPFFTAADCLALVELFLGVACLPEDLVMMVGMV